MNLTEAVNVIDNTDFGPLKLDPELLQAISVLVLASKTKARTEQEFVANRVLETSTDQLTNPPISDILLQ